MIKMPPKKTDFGYLRNLNRLRPEMHLALHMAVLTIIDKYGTGVLHLEPHIDIYLLDIETERIELQNSAPGKMAKYRTARYSTDRQFRCMIHVVYMFNACMPSEESDAFIIELKEFLKERLNIRCRYRKCKKPIEEKK
ncbi:hypothetical protein [Bacteroides timonensis]|uniref:hypothetical protein n=1 Tax=Bacteroides timonensis TaxID=1470345 RepID=UPI0004B337B3|nr:hypothetical protein [Bacteroides timonensis]